MFLELFLASTQELIEEVKVGGVLGCTGHALVEFVILRKTDLPKSKVRILNFRRANLRILKDLLSEFPWEAVLTDKGV